MTKIMEKSLLFLFNLLEGTRKKVRNVQVKTMNKCPEKKSSFT